MSTRVWYVEWQLKGIPGWIRSNDSKASTLEEAMEYIDSFDCPREIHHDGQISRFIYSAVNETTGQRIIP